MTENMAGNTTETTTEDMANVYSSSPTRLLREYIHPNTPQGRIDSFKDNWGYPFIFVINYGLVKDKHCPVGHTYESEILYQRWRVFQKCIESNGCHPGCGNLEELLRLMRNPRYSDGGYYTKKSCHDMIRKTYEALSSISH